MTVRLVMAANSTCIKEGTTASSNIGYGLNALGIALGCIGSISINIGNNLQARGHNLKQQSTWLLGTVVFFLASLIQFVAFAFAPASVVAPLESLQFVRAALSIFDPCFIRHIFYSHTVLFLSLSLALSLSLFTHTHTHTRTHTRARAGGQSPLLQVCQREDDQS